MKTMQFPQPREPRQKGNNPPCPSDFVEMWQRGYDTQAIAGLLRESQADVERWLNRYLDTKVNQ